MQKAKIVSFGRSLQAVLMLASILIFLVTITPQASSHDESELESLTESGMELLISTFEMYEIGSGRWLDIGLDVGIQLDKNEELYAVFVSALENEEASIRAGVAWVMSFHRSEKETSLPLLTEMLEDPDPYVRILAAQAICYLREDNQVGLDVLIEALNDSTPDVRHQAIVGFMVLTSDRTITANWDAAIPSIVGLLPDEERANGRIAATSLAHIGKPAVHYLIDVLESGNNYAVASTAYALEHMEYPEALEAVPALIELLNGEDEELNYRLAKAIAAAGREEGYAAAPLLEQVLRESYGSKQYDAARRLGNIGPPASFTTPTILTVWYTADDALKTALAYALVRFDGPDARFWIDTLVGLASSDVEQIRWKAARFLTDINLTEDLAMEIFPELISISEDRLVREKAVISLEFYLPNPIALEAIKKMVDDEIPRVRCEALRSLGHMEPITDVIGIIEAGLNDEDWTVRRVAAEILGQIGEISENGLSKLRLMAETDEKYEVQEASQKALLSIDQNA